MVVWWLPIVAAFVFVLILAAGQTANAPRIANVFKHLGFVYVILLVFVAGNSTAILMHHKFAGSGASRNHTSRADKQINYDSLLTSTTPNFQSGIIGRILPASQIEQRLRQ